MGIKKLFAAAAMIIGVMGFGASQASLITFEDSGGSPISFPQYIAANGLLDTFFTIPASKDPGETQIHLDVGTVDEGFALIINGTTIFDVAHFDRNDLGAPVGIAGPGLDQPWLNYTAGPRIQAFITETSVTLAGQLELNSDVYTALILDSLTLPIFLVGQNTLSIQNRNQFGVGEMTGVELVGRVPEPSTIMLLGLGLAGLGFARKRMAA